MFFLTSASRRRRRSTPSAYTSSASSVRARRAARAAESSGEPDTRATVFPGPIRTPDAASVKAARVQSGAARPGSAWASEARRLAARMRDIFFAPVHARVATYVVSMRASMGMDKYAVKP